jgi:two-component system, NarL family, nitrate/nitrite response regulator NarL
VTQSGRRSRSRRQLEGDALTTRESQILEMISKGLTNVEIAVQLGLTVHAIKFHLTGVYRKLGVSNRTAAAVVYMQAADDRLAALTIAK